MKPLTGKEATATFSPTKGHSVVIYTHKFKPQDFRKGVEIVTKQFPDAQVKHGQKRHNIFLERPDDNELVNVSFFDGAGVDDWHKSPHRLDTVKRLQDMLEKPIDVQVFEVADVVGIS
jgi:hypothetical protein